MHIELNDRLMSLVTFGMIVFAFAGPSKAQVEKTNAPVVQVNLAQYGLPGKFFNPGYEGACEQIIGYRFVVWLNPNVVAIGFNTSPNCRVTPGLKVDGLARILIFRLDGSLAAKRDISYLADGNGEMVANGEALEGPAGTLLFDIQSVDLEPDGSRESKSGVLLLDAALNNVAQRDGFLEQTTFVDHTLIFQDGVVLNGPRTYRAFGKSLTQVAQKTYDWPIGTMDRKFGDHGVAFMLCEQEQRPYEYTKSNVIYSRVRRQCSINAQIDGAMSWERRLDVNETAAIVGLLENGDIVAEINPTDHHPSELVIWREKGPPQLLPWLSKDYFGGELANAMIDMSRYAAWASVGSGRRCHDEFCNEKRRWIVFDRRSKSALIDREFPKEGRAALSPDGSHYASFEAGQMRIYAVPNK